MNQIIFEKLSRQEKTLIETALYIYEEKCKENLEKPGYRQSKIDIETLKKKIGCKRIFLGGNFVDCNGDCVPYDG